MASSNPPLPRSSLQTSPAPSHSQQQKLPTLSKLIAYLVSSKRSLSSINLVQRATNILEEAKVAIESATALSARSTYLRRSLASQVKILRGVHNELESAAQTTHTEVRMLVKELDNEDRQLEQSIQKLKDTPIEEAFKARAVDGHTNGNSGEEEAILHDFIDDKPVYGLRDSIKSALDNVERAKQDMDDSIQTLEEDLETINAAINKGAALPASPTTSATTHTPDLRQILHNLDEHAREMAEGLQSLVKHFDLCVKAIRHTEGGGDAVAKNMESEQLNLPSGVGDIDAEDFSAPTKPMTEDERTEMLAVLENDAAEVDEVVNELHDRNADMEAQLDQVLAWKSRGEVTHTHVMDAFALLEKVGARVSSYVGESARYTARWAEEKARIEDGMAGMQELRDVYQNFLDAYDGLIVEFARRRAVKRQMEKVAAEAHGKLLRLYDDDLAEREAFRNERGDFLPSDIWGGLDSLPPRFEVSRVDRLQGDDGGVESTAELPRKTVEEALKRLRARSVAAGEGEDQSS